jgi:hypothetical protein
MGKETTYETNILRTYILYKIQLKLFFWYRYQTDEPVQTTIMGQYKETCFYAMNQNKL